MIGIWYEVAIACTEEDLKVIILCIGNNEITSSVIVEITSSDSDRSSIVIDWIARKKCEI